jgi:hypothetical protein
MKKTHLGMIGLSLDSDSLSFINGDENLGGRLDEGEGRNDASGGFNLDLELLVLTTRKKLHCPLPWMRLMV